MIRQKPKTTVNPTPGLHAEALETRRLLSSYTFNTLAALNSTQLSDPSGVLVEDTKGDLFFLATQGASSSNTEALCELSKGSSTPSVLASFPNQGGNVGGLAIDTAGDLFGLSNTGGAHNNGTVWELPAGSGTVVTLASFNGPTTGSDPQLGHNLVIDTNGNLFGTTQLGGTDSGGTVWELASGSGTITALASFQQAVSNNTPNGLSIDASGNLFGTIGRDISISGAHGDVWELPKGASTINVLVSFNGTNGDEPESPLYVDSNGNVFGETNAGGTGVSGTPNVGDGTLFEIAAGNNTPTTLASFTGGADGAGPRFGVAADSAGDLFGSARDGGATSGGRNHQGVIYELAKGSATIVPIENFNATTTSSPATTILVDANANVFGTTPSGGGGGGIVFELTPGGGGGGGGASSITPTIGGKVPASAIAGQKLNASQAVALTASAAVSGTVTAALYLDTGTTVDANAIKLGSVSKKLKLKAHGHSSLSFKIKGIPATVPNGTYHFVVQVTDPSGNTSDAASSGTLTVAPPQIDLSGSFSKTPAPAKNGKTILTFTVNELGNITASDPLAFNIDSSPDGMLADATVLNSSSKKINIKAGKAMKISAVTTLPAGTYFVLIQLDPSNSFHDVNPANNVFSTASKVTVA